MVQARYDQQKVTIAVGASKSDYIETRGSRIVGIQVPADTEGDEVSFFADPTGVIDENDAHTDEAEVTDGGSTPALVLVPWTGITLPTVVNIDKDTLPPASYYALQTRDSTDSDNVIVQSGAAAEIIVILERIHD